MNEKLNVKDYKLIKYEPPKLGDLIFKFNDYHEEEPFKIFKIEEDNKKVIVIQRKKEKYKIYNVFGVNLNGDIYKFIYSNCNVFQSNKVRKDSKNEIKLKKELKLIKNK